MHPPQPLGEALSHNRSGHRKKAMFGFLTIATVLALASAAFACTTYKGRFTVQGNGYPEKTAVGANIGGKMAWCDGTVPKASMPASNGSTWNVRVHVSPQTGSCAASLPDNTYYVDLQMGTGYVGDCMHGSSLNTTLGTMKVRGGYSVDSNGNWIWYYYDFAKSPGQATICVSDAGAYYGNQMAADVL